MEFNSSHTHSTHAKNDAILLLILHCFDRYFNLSGDRIYFSFPFKVSFGQLAKIAKIDRVVQQGVKVSSFLVFLVMCCFCSSHDRACFGNVFFLLVFFFLNGVALCIIEC